LEAFDAEGIAGPGEGGVPGYFEVLAEEAVGVTGGHGIILRDRRFQSKGPWHTPCRKQVNKRGPYRRKKRGPLFDSPFLRRYPRF
jgi:hypothetical protein